MGNSKKVMLIGWDAADWKVVNKLIDEGKMPWTQKLVDSGTSGNLQTLFPALSPMLWTSISTGKRPYKHGIYGFTEPAADGKSVQPMSNLSRNCKAVWNILNQHDMESVVVGWWPSHPAEPINGAMVSDLFTKAPKKPGDPFKVLPGSVHPPELLNELKSLRVHPTEITAEHVLQFVPDARDVDQEHDSRIGMLIKTIAECSSIQSIATHLLETRSWDFAAIYFADIDHFCHGFMKYHPPRQAHVSEEDFRLYHHVIEMAYIYHDMLLGRLMEFTSQDTTIVLMSDHGFHPDHLRPKSRPLEPAGPATEHRDLGIFAARGPGIKEDHLIHGANLLDITPTLLTLFGLPVGEDMDGTVLREIFENPPEIETIPTWEAVAGEHGGHPDGFEIAQADSKAALDQLVALGYVEQPDDNSETAIANCVRELDYNLARSYMDGGLYGEAVPLLLGLYQEFPLEFRFGIQLANCLVATERHADLKVVVDDLNARWRVASEIARERVKEILATRKERKKLWLEMKKVDDENKNDQSNSVRLAKVDKNGLPVLFSASEHRTISKIKGIAKGNPQTLDYLNATLAVVNDDYESALQFMVKSELTQSQAPSFQYQVGNVYLGLDREADAERAYLRSIDLDESYPEGHLGLARLSLKQKKPKKAIEFAKRALGLKYFFPVAHFCLGRAYRQTGNVEAAVNSLNVAVEQNPNFQEAHDILAAIHENSSTDEGRSQWDLHNFAAKQLAEKSVANAGQVSSIKFPEVNTEELAEALPSLQQDANTDEFVHCLGQSKLTPPDEQEGFGASGQAQTEDIYIVSGLPRSGTSMMMQMLKAGGLPVFEDGNRSADESNPRGYLETDLAKQLMRKNIWLKGCFGKVVKVVAPLIPYLPQEFNYKIIFMERDISEIVGSQKKMLERLGKEGGGIEMDSLEAVFSKQASYAKSLLTHYGHPLATFNFRDVISSPGDNATKISEFIGRELDVDAMLSQVDSSLYRQRQ